MPVYRNPWVVSQAGTLHDDEDGDDEGNHVASRMLGIWQVKNCFMACFHCCLTSLIIANCPAQKLPNSVSKVPRVKQRKPFSPFLRQSLMKLQFDFNICICYLVFNPSFRPDANWKNREG